MKLSFYTNFLASILLIPNLIFAYQLGGDKKVEEKKTRVNLTADDFSFPMSSFSNKITDFITVAIYGTGDQGSGVIIAQKDNDYYVLTAKHVIGEILKGDFIEVQTLDGEYHDSKLLKSDEEIDAALIKFSSQNKYYKAFISTDVKPKTGLLVVSHGYALASKEAKKKSLRKSIGRVITIIEDNKDGYDLLYDAATNVGMSGGGIYSEFPLVPMKGSGETYDWIPYRKDLTEWEIQMAKSQGVTFNHEEDKNNFSARLYQENHPCEFFTTPVLIGIHGRSESYRTGGKSGTSMGLNIHTLLSKFGPTLINEGITALPKERETLIFKDGCPIYDAVNPYSQNKAN